MVQVIILGNFGQRVGEKCDPSKPLTHNGCYGDLDSTECRNGVCQCKKAYYEGEKKYKCRTQGSMISILHNISSDDGMRNPKDIYNEMMKMDKNACKYERICYRSKLIYICYNTRVL